MRRPRFERRGVRDQRGRLGQGRHVVSTNFLGIVDGAACTPLSLDARGRIYALANGILTVLGD